jgi:hypothetical protein
MSGRAFTPLSSGLNSFAGVSYGTPETSYTITLTVCRRTARPRAA